MFGNFPPQTGYQGPGDRASPPAGPGAPSRGAAPLLPGPPRVRARGVHPAQAAELRLRQWHGKHRHQPQRRYRHGRRPELTTQQRHEQRRSYKGQSLHFNYTGSRLERAPLHWVITIFLKIIDSNVKKSLVKTNTRL